MYLIRAVQTETTRPLPVIARSPCEEAIQTVSAERFLDCFATLAMTEYVVSRVAPRIHGIPRTNSLAF
ncbi:hypothetical protein XH96_14470 [Bradyrhizobium sp. CCBAU 51765]|nr:hypothetical protein XH96_14470 [Bradyrhizobium sp. CCBAU 51765]